ncbi:MAG: hypothetical protein AAFQ16_13470 [Pseudomonadota bacterium]
MSCVVLLYLVFSPVGLVDGGNGWLLPLWMGLVAINLVVWVQRFRSINTAIPN